MWRMFYCLFFSFLNYLYDLKLKIVVLYGMQENICWWIELGYHTLYVHVHSIVVTIKYFNYCFQERRK